MTLDEKVRSLLAAGPIRMSLAEGADSDGLWIAIEVADGQRYGGRSFIEAVDLAVMLRERQEADEAAS